MIKSEPDKRPVALVVAHPGHEARIHGWLEQEKPIVFVFTDGSGRSGRSRLDSTSRLLAGAGARRGAIYGRFREREFYGSVLTHEFDVFLRLADELAELFLAGGVHRVVGDAAEGYNSTHDVCRLVTNAAVELACGISSIENFDFPVVGQPDSCPEHLRSEAIWLRLDEDAFERKIVAARLHFPELVAEVVDALRGNGSGPLLDYLNSDGGLRSPAIHELEIFRTECLRPVSKTLTSSHTPFYERHGERQVAAGYYSDVIRFEEHVRPIAEALRHHVEGN